MKYRKNNEKTEGKGNLLIESLKVIKKIFQGIRQKPKYFCHSGVYTIFFCTGFHTVTINPKCPIKKVKIDEVEEYENIYVCGGQGNTYDYEIDADKIIIKAIVHTSIGVVKIFVN